MRWPTITRLRVFLFLLLVVVAGAAYYAYVVATGPMFTPGSVASRPVAELTPPKQEGGREGIWTVEEGIDLHFSARGTGRPVLVVHGGPGVPFAGPFEALSELESEYRFYYYHQRGCGLSSRPFDRFDGGSFYANAKALESRLGLGEQIADIERIRRLLGVEKIGLIGHSFGGFIATLYAAEFPERVDGLVLLAPAGLLSRPDAERDLFSRAAARLGDEERVRFEALRSRYFDFPGHFERSDAEIAKLHLEIGTYLLEAMGYGDPSPVADGGDRRPFVGGWSVVACYLSLGLDWDFRQVLGEVEAGTTILIGADDELARAGTESYAGISGSELVVLGREVATRPVRHFAYDECPRHFADAVRRRLASR